jgi:ATP-dependent exoDNAse (exonuclease V) beta subunit
MRRAARVDNTAKELVKAARQMGAEYLPLNHVIDGILLHRSRVHLIDWKSKGGTLTPDQAKLVAAGWPIKFVQTVDQLVALLNG